MAVVVVGGGVGPAVVVVGSADGAASFMQALPPVVNDKLGMHAPQMALLASHVRQSGTPHLTGTSLAFRRQPGPAARHLRTEMGPAQPMISASGVVRPLAVAVFATGYVPAKAERMVIERTTVRRGVNRGAVVRQKERD